MKLPKRDDLENKCEIFLYYCDKNEFFKSCGLPAYRYKSRFFPITEYIINSLPKNTKILDVGSASCNFSLYLANMGYNVFALDIKPEFISYAKKKVSTEMENRNIKFIVQDGFNISFPPNSFDCIIALEVIEHTYFPEKLMEQLLDMLKPNGLLIVSTVNRERLHKFFSTTKSFPAIVKNRMIDIEKESSFSGKKHVYEFTFKELNLFFQKFSSCQILKHSCYTPLPLLPFSFSVPFDKLITIEKVLMKFLKSTRFSYLYFGQYIILKKK